MAQQKTTDPVGSSAAPTGASSNAAVPANTTAAAPTSRAAEPASVVGMWTIPSTAARMAAPTGHAVSDSIASSSDAPSAATTTTNTAAAATNARREAIPIIMPRRPPMVALERPPVGWPIPVSERVADAPLVVSPPSDTTFVATTSRGLAASRSTLPTRWTVPAAAPSSEEDNDADDEAEDEDEEEEEEEDEDEEMADEE